MRERCQKYVGPNPVQTVLAERTSPQSDLLTLTLKVWFLFALVIFFLPKLPGSKELFHIYCSHHVPVKF